MDKEDVPVPYCLRLADGRTVFVEVPARMAVRDRGGELAFTPEGVRMLDRVRALTMRPAVPPSPAYLAALRDALGLTQQELGRRIGRSKLTVSRWERGTLRPSQEALEKLYALAAGLKRRGIVLAG
jgi:DNA-binding transcriptional regulator YiaG